MDGFRSKVIRNTTCWFFESQQAEAQQLDLIMGQDISQIQDSSNMMGSSLNYSKKIKNPRRQHLIDWSQVHCFYEDSEGDLNVISEDEDLSDARIYAAQK